MRENDGRKLDHKTLETLRLRAVDQVRGGEHPEDVAAALGMDRSTVYGWVAKAARDGREALRARPVPGRPPKLSPEQAQRVYQVVVGKNPTQVGFDFGLWTRDLVRQVIANEFKVKMSAVSVGRLLARLGLSPQRPVHRAWQADEEKVAAWKQTEYPKIAAAAKKAGAVVYFGDEASVRSDHHAGTTWAPVGRTPVVTQGTGARFSVNMVSAVTATGQLRFQIVDGTMTGPKFVEFCKPARRHRPARRPGRRQPPRPPLQGRARVGRHHGRTVHPGLPAALLTPAQPRRAGLEQRQEPPRRQAHHHQPRPAHQPVPGRPAPPAEAPRHRPRLLRTPRPGIHPRGRSLTGQSTYL